MSNIRTVRKTIADDWKEPESGNTAQINRAICQALYDLRPHEFTFNVDEFSFDTVADQQAYAKASRGESTTNLLPWNFLSVLGSQLAIDVGSAGTDFRVLRDVSKDASERQDWARNEDSGVPAGYAFWNDQLFFVPTPSEVSTVDGRCLVDLGTPVPHYDGSSWTYRINGRNTPVPSAALNSQLGSSVLTSQLQNLVDPGAGDVSPFPFQNSDSALYIGFPHRFHTITLAVSTAGIGAYTVSWEFWDGTAWTAIPSVVDNTDSFKTLGSNTVTFTAANVATWETTSMLGGGVESLGPYYYIRAKHDEGAQSTDPLLSYIYGDFDDFSNDWFTEAFDVLVSRASWHFLSRHLHDEKRASIAAAAYVKSIRELKADRGPKLTIGRIRPWMGGI